MRRLSNHELISAYTASIQLRLDPEFVNMLLREIHARNLQVTGAGECDSNPLAAPAAEGKSSR
ncbi:sporulation histidine kinase inhibitor Sda [Paenibacillus puerhi]|uniref:sporulation histidine kinase inhibitor Sda n=1 Tax=Paenibacillus puerhi TaxID=2692622 RepID=UPI00135A5BA2|nr:sporulation histidine kinase inhibitor Sda [Paenibacillus puerhi]